MVTRAQIDRISSRIDALAAELAPPRPDVVVIEAWYGHEEEARAEHFAKFPADRNAKKVIVLRQFRREDCLKWPYRVETDPDG